jgi:hypothetical protein
MRSSIEAIMKRAVLCVAAVLLGGTFASSALAHPPQQVQLSFAAPGTLTVKVVHPVNDPAKHYISKIVVTVNGKVTADRTYTGQGSPDGMSETFSLGSVPKGATIRAEATCSIMGSAVGQITAP